MDKYLWFGFELRAWKITGHPFSLTFMLADIQSRYIHKIENAKQVEADLTFSEGASKQKFLRERKLEFQQDLIK